MGKERKFERYKNERIYNIWYKMVSRCLYEEDPAFMDYGHRGITVCEDWANSFKLFVDWSMKNGYKNNLSIDRIDNNGPYCPSNCRWATCKEQSLNKRNNIKIHIEESTMCLSELSEKFCLHPDVIKRRIKKGVSGLDLLVPNKLLGAGERHIVKVSTNGCFKFRVRVSGITIGQYDNLIDAIRERNKYLNKGSKK